MALTRIVSEIIQDNTIENRDISGSFTAGISGSWRGELSSSNMTDVGGGVSGSVTSTGSFGRVEAAGVVFADSFESVTGGATIDFNDNVNLTGNLTATGNISSSFTSTGSFGRVQTTNIDIDSISGNWTNAGNTVADLGTVTTVDINGGTIDGITSLTAGGNLDIGAHGFRASTLTADSQTSGRVAIYSTAGLLSEDSDLTFSGATLSATNVTTTGTIKDFASVSGSYVSTGSVGRIQTRAAAIGTITGTTLSVTGNISSSATSTGSVGRLETQQTNASLGGSIINLAGNLTTAGTLTTQNNNVTINAAGAARTLTLNESLTVGDGHDGTITFGAASKTLTIENTSLLNQDLTTDASPTFAGATITGTLTVQEVHTEFESASILFTSGSTKFGNTLDDMHNFTGSIHQSGSGKDHYFLTGNVGLGTSAPAAKLHVYSGNISGSSLSTGSLGRLELAGNMGAFTLGGKLTAGAMEIEGSNFDINGGTIDGITSLTAGGDLDIGSHGFRAATLTADGLTAGRVPFAGTAGLLSDDSDLTFATATLSATNLTTTGTIKNMALVSGSSVSTGSFGHITLSEGLEIGGVFKASLSNNDAGTSNTIFGKSAGDAIASGGNYNVVIGEGAGGALTTGDTSVAVGFEALLTEDTNSENTAIGYQALKTQNGADGNTAVGMRAGLDLTTGANNTFVGAEVAQNVTTGLDNVIIGKAAGGTTQTTSGSVYIGRSAGNAATTGNQNIGIGKTALGGAATTGDNNVAIGTESGDALTSGFNNVAIGKQSFTRATTANENIAIGNNALGQNTYTSSGSVAIGYFALGDASTGAMNVGIGYRAGKSILTGYSNVIIGEDAGRQITTARENVIIGANAYESANSSENFAVVIGYNAANLLDGIDNVVAIGHSALSTMVAVDGNTAVGFEAGKVTTGANNTYLGFKAGKGASGAETGNVGFGTEALTAITTGANNNCIGYGAGKAIQGGASNIIIGKNAGDSAISANQNIIIGQDAGQALEDVDTCIIIGHDAGKSINNTAAAGAVAIGYTALGDLTSGARCTAVGYTSIYANSEGSDNTAVGYGSLSGVNHVDADHNTAIGVNGGSNIVSGYQNTHIGSNNQPSAAGAINQTTIGYAVTAVANNSVTLGNSSVTAVYAGSDSGAVVHAAGMKFDNDQTNNIDEANTLDDYEEGDYTITVSILGGTGSVTLVGSKNQAQYTKIGRMVHISGEISVSSVSSPSGHPIAFNLPFTVGDITDLAERVSGVCSVQNVDATDAIETLHVNTYGGQSVMTIVGTTDEAGWTNINANGFQANSEMVFSLSYISA